MRHRSRTIEERRQLVAAYRVSGLSVQAFAEREGLTTSTVYKWLSSPRRLPAPPPRVARVVVTEVKAPAERAVPLVLEIGGARMLVNAGFDRRVLSEVIGVLEARR